MPRAAGRFAQILPARGRVNARMNILTKRVHDPNSGSFGARQILNCLTIDECHVVQIEHDSGLPLKGEQILQPRHMFIVHFSAKDKHNGVGCHRALDSVCQA